MGATRLVVSILGNEEDGQTDKQGVQLIFVRLLKEE